jgi:ectoine hydroxylase-related dioxygenase (phytanoyl-CoA dioxygenase family)
MLFHDQALYKPPNSGGEVFGHQDNGYWLAKPANLVSCWLTLDDVSVESGAMQFLPGSHFAELNHQRPDILLQAEVSNVSDTVILEIGAAECLFHHCLAPHRTAPNTSERDRRAIAIHYMQPGTRRENGDGIAVSFESPLVRMAV